LEFKNLIIDRGAYKVTFRGKDLSIPRKEFELLYLLASNPEKVFKRENIMDKVWGSEVVVGDRTIDVHIRNLEKKLEITYLKL
jgi:two-component system alkaline phosphatase synthesis response regulator PhoP